MDSLSELRARAKRLGELHMVGGDEWNDVCRSIERATLLVTMTISVNRDGTLKSDVQTHDNSYADVAVGLAAVKKEIERVFAEHKNCPYYPSNAEEANKKILRSVPLP